MSNLTHLIERAVQVSGTKVATVCNGRRRTYVEVAERIARFAGALQSLGCKSDTRIAVLSLNNDRYFECYFALPWVGCEIVPLNTRWSVAENMYSLNDSNAEVLIFDDAFTGVVEEILSKSEIIRLAIHIGDAETPAWAKSYEALIEESTAVENAHVAADSRYGIFYTGGTTGFPKGVMLTHTAIWSSGICGTIDFDMDETTTYLHVAPMFHLADFAGLIGTTIKAGTHVFMSAFDPGTVPRVIAEHGVTHVILVPVMIKMVLDHPAINEFDLSGLKRIIYGASPITVSVLEQAMRTLPECGFVQAYGQTELAPLATMLRPEHHVVGGSKLRSAGRPTFCVNVKIVDADGQEVPTGEVGEIIVKGPNTMMGYWNKPEQTATALKNGWVYTGDAGRMDEDGFLFIADRVKDMIVTGGENVFSAEVENAVSSHQHVVDVAVIGIPSDEWGESVHAIVISSENVTVTEADIIQHCKKLIAGYKCPKSVEFRTNPFPLSGANKVLKTELRKHWWEGRERKVN
jgi:acyl-CoA synthetase (AMP-forming)/AMP-acid ligase II